MPDQHAGSENGVTIFLRQARLLLTDTYPTRQQPTIGRAPTPKNSRSVYYFDKEELAVTGTQFSRQRVHGDNMSIEKRYQSSSLE
jgi:hypothetical protein